MRQAVGALPYQDCPGRDRLSARIEGQFSHCVSVEARPQPDNGVNQANYLNISDMFSEI